MNQNCLNGESAGASFSGPVGSRWFKISIPSNTSSSVDLLLPLTSSQFSDRIQCTNRPRTISHNSPSRCTCFGQKAPTRRSTLLQVNIAFIRRVLFVDISDIFAMNVKKRDFIGSIWVLLSIYRYGMRSSAVVGQSQYEMIQLTIGLQKAPPTSVSDRQSSLPWEKLQYTSLRLNSNSASQD